MLTGFLILSLRDTYDLTPHLKLISNRGLMFFIFPFETHSLYRVCGDRELLVGTSLKPSPENFEKMTSVESLEAECPGLPKVEKMNARGTLYFSGS